ncbi:hypothetical protein [Streptomyces racemochromogenes]
MVVDQGDEYADAFVQVADSGSGNPGQDLVEAGEAGAGCRA